MCQDIIICLGTIKIPQEKREMVNKIKRSNKIKTCKDTLRKKGLFFFAAPQKIEEAIMEANAKTEIIKNKFVQRMSEYGVNLFLSTSMSLYITRSIS